MTQPIALCWAAGVKWGRSVPRMQALFVWGALDRNYTAGSNDPNLRREPAPQAPQPPHHQAGEMRVTPDDTTGGGGGETLLLNTSPTDRCRWPFLNLIIVVPTQGEMAWDFLWHPLLYLFPPSHSDSQPRSPSLFYRLTHLYTDAYASIYLSICLADVADVPCWRWQYSHTDPL